MSDRFRDWQQTPCSRPSITVAAYLSYWPELAFRTCEHRWRYSPREWTFSTACQKLTADMSIAGTSDGYQQLQRLYISAVKSLC